MKLVLALMLLALAVVVFGMAGFFGYQLYWKPRQLDAKAAIEEVTQPAPPPDYSLPAFERAMELEKSGDVVEARKALREFIGQYPQSTKLAEAKAALGNINMDLVFSNGASPDKTDYSVVSGDSLVRIAQKTGSNAELIFRVNNMESINLQIGQALTIPKLDISLVADRGANTLTVLNGGEFFKEYPALGFRVNLPGSKPVEAKVADKIAVKGEKRVAFGDRDYVDSDRSILLSSGGVMIRGLPEGVTDAGAMPAGIVLSREDIDEVFLLVSKGNPVTIR
jgi:LysM repeat protein